MRYWHRVASLKEVGTYLVSRGMVPAEILRRNGLPASLLLDSNAWIEREVCFRLVADIARHSGDPYLGLHFAEVQRLQDYGPWAEGILRSPTLRHALDFAAERISLIRTGLAVRRRIEGDRVLLSAEFLGVNDRDALHPSLACMTTLYRIVRLAVDPREIEVRLCLPPQRLTDEVERLLGSRLVFDAERNEVTFDIGALGLPLRTLTLPEHEVFGLLRTGQPLVTAREAYSEMRELLSAGPTTVVDVAHALDISVRQLQRHLSRWGVTFEGMLDEFRRTSALTQLSDNRYSVTEIAHQLGYSDSSHFTRAVRRWTGRSPRQIRLHPPLVQVWRDGPLPETRARALLRATG
ncbi:MAG: AraC family transcriptional regulator ligand-binding domain-containing protein [Pseudomonadales bacterium]|nr:AraC family transcriptional regulator ligand-binding domain-containing protein [Pseudomonadales bacterium]